MKKSLSLVFAMVWMQMVSAQSQITSLLTNNTITPNFITTAAPRFTWKVSSNKRNAVQTAYQVQVYQGKSIIWDSEKQNSDQSVYIDYKGKPLQSNTNYQWSVKVWTNVDAAPLTEKSTFHTALMQLSDWKAKWIAPGFEESKERPSPIFRKEFIATKKIKSAFAYITAHGMYEASINGKRVGDVYLTPGWTSYHNRLQFQTFDVTNMLQKGNNAIGATLGSGWYRGIIGFERNVNFYGKDIALLMQINIRYEDGSEAIIATDGSWKANTGSIAYSEIYNGEVIDARLEKKGWNQVGFNDNAWLPAKEVDYTLQNLVTTENELVKKHEILKPVKIFTTPKGEKVIDFGQNLVGWVTMKVNGAFGTKITLSHAEVLDKKGNFYTENLRAAKAQDIYVCSGTGEEVFEPHFTWQGFRYVKIEGYPGEITADHFVAAVLYSDMPLAGSFSSSHVLINQLQHNIQWGQQGNFLDVPTDCPQRDERLGWTGDAQVFSRTAMFNRNVHNFFAKWLKDVAADQVEGKVPFVVPNVLSKSNVNSTGWSDVATIIPWNLYLAYGDKKILEDQYASMKNYVASINTVAKNHLWNTGFHFGDWLFYRPEDDNDGRSAVTDKYLIAQCFYAASTQILLNTAKVLNKTDDILYYTDLLSKVKTAFINEYVTPNGRVLSSTQTAYVLALQYDMLPESARAATAKKLVENIESYGNHLTTGFLGTPYLCNVLTKFGYDDVAYKLLLQETYPSWLYPVKMGATTIWERWDGQKTDSSFQSIGMNSFNHYAYGAIGDWMYRNMVGIDTYEDGVGYKHIRIQPHIGGTFTHADASLDTYYGKVSAGWKKENSKLIMDVQVPFNTRANIFIPATAIDKVYFEGIALPNQKAMQVIQASNGYVEISAGAGQYQFTVQP